MKESSPHAEVKDEDGDKSSPERKQQVQKLQRWKQQGTCEQWEFSGRLEG